MQQFLIMTLSIKQVSNWKKFLKQMYEIDPVKQIFK